MSASPLNAVTNPSEILATLNLMSLPFNPYRLVLTTIEDQIAKLPNRNIPSVDLAFIVVHFILLVQATITLGLKLFLLLKNGQRNKIWLWRKHYLLDQPIPYLVPNGNFVIEPLQITGCILFELVSMTIYWAIRHPDLGMPLTGIQTGFLFWMAISFVPGFVGIWLSGWTAFYAIFLSPVHHNVPTGMPKRILHHPVFMNAICIAVPVLMSCFFAIVGIIMAAKHKRVGDGYEVLTTQLNQLAEVWKPHSTQSGNENENLVDTLELLLAEGSQILDLLRIMAIGWATAAVLVVSFYMGTMITIGKALSTAKKMSSESHMDLYSKAETNCSESLQPMSPAFRNCGFANNIQRNFIFLRTSCGLTVIALGFNICTGFIFATKVRAILIQTYWQAHVVSLMTATGVLLSLSLLVQSLIHIGR